jgi:hypothetical protein
LLPYNFSSQHPLHLFSAFSTALFLLCAAMPVSAASDAGGTLTVKPEKSRLYIGESTRVIIILQTAGAATVRNMSYPRLTAPGLTIGEFAPPRSVEYLQDGVAAVRHEFSTLVTPRTAGVHQLGPVSVSGEVSAPSNDAGSFFGETTAQKISFEAPPSDLTVVPLPAFGRPADFSGVVGQFTMNVSAVPTSMPSGTPLTVTTRISGAGNLQKAACPEVREPKFKVYPAHVHYSANAMLCTQLIIPQTPSATSVPSLQFSFFNSSTARYESLQSAAIPLTVTEQNMVKGVVPNRQPLPQNTASTPHRSLLSWWRWLLLAVAAVSSLFLIWGRKTSKNIEMHLCSQQFVSVLPSSEACLLVAEQALTCNDVEQFYLSVYRALENMRGNPSVTKHSEIALLFAECDAVRFGRHHPEYQEMKLILDRLKTLLTSGYLK